MTAGRRVRVAVAVGDPANNDGLHTINVEGTNFFNAVPDANTAIVMTAQVSVSDGRLEAFVRPVVRPDNPNVGIAYPPRWKLLLFDHTTMAVRELPFDLPRTLDIGETRTIVVDALAGRRVIPGDVAPDGYRVESLSSSGGGGGIVNELFGMNRRYRRGIAVGRNGRTVQLELPAPYRESYGSIVTIGWIVDENR